MSERTGSELMIGEYLEAGDPRLLDEVLACRSDRALAALAERWYADRRPFAREALLGYVADGCDRSHHRPLVKRLFKRAEEAGDDELMGRFLVAFDRLSRRQLVPVARWDWQTREQWTEYVLQEDRSIFAYDPYHSRDRAAPSKDEYAADRFSRHTRRYLSRRAFRYFRRLGREDPVRYRTAVCAALLRYEDAHLDKPEKLLDAWGLAQILYWGSPVIARRPGGIVLAEGRTLAEIAPAPIHPDAWKGCFDELFSLMVQAKSRTVRVWAAALLERDYAGELERLPFVRLRPLLDSPDDALQLFAAKRLASATGLDNLPLTDWLAILDIQNPAALPLLCDLFAKYVAPERLTLEQTVRFACSRVAPVAALGWRWIRGREVQSEGELEQLLALRDAPVGRVRSEAAAWLSMLLGDCAFATPLHLRELIDCRHADVRAEAMQLLAWSSRFSGALPIWRALAESPYPDVRDRLVASLKTHVGGLEPDTVRHVWATALLSVHRGGRTKRTVAAQVARRVVERPEESRDLLPLLGLVLRSVRVPERRVALAALAQAAFRRPALREAIQSVLPELELEEERP